MEFDWNLAIKRNTQNLARIVAGLFVLAGWVPGDERPTFLRRAVRNELARLLRVSEAALRRLILITVKARGIGGDAAASLPGARRLPDFASFGKGDGTRTPVFNLVDPRKPLRFPGEDEWYGEETCTSEPRVWSVDVPRPLVADQLRLAHRQAQGEGYEGHITACTTAQAGALAELNQNPTRILRRLQALDHALKNLPRQAKRMARLLEKAGGHGESRSMLSRTRAGVHPIRPGLPPGFSPNSSDEVDCVLRECHGLLADLRAAEP